jgi:hypothetical protein
MAAPVRVRTIRFWPSAVLGLIQGDDAQHQSHRSGHRLPALIAASSVLALPRMRVALLITSPSFEALWSDQPRRRAAAVEIIRELVQDGLTDQQRMVASHQLKHWAAVNWELSDEERRRLESGEGSGESLMVGTRIPNLGMP